MNPVPFFADFVSILVFVIIGRMSHDHGISVDGVSSTLWPFAIGLLVGWAAMMRRRRSGMSLADAEWIVISTVAVGMVLRVIAGQGTAFAFVVVAGVFLSAFMLGWRLAVGFLHRARR